MEDDRARIERLESEVQRLARELSALSARIAGAAPTAAPPAGDRRPPPPPPLRPPPWARPEAETPGDAGPLAPYAAGPELDTEPDAGHGGYVLDSETVLKWGGVGLVVLAVGFAVSTAISRGWIGPELQLAGAVGLSLALIRIGLHLRPTRPAWTHALCSGGALALFTTAASDLFVDQTSDDVAFAATAAIGLGGLALARLVPSEWVSGATLGGGIVGWQVIGETEPPLGTTLAWVVALVAATLALAVEQRWFVVRFLAHGTGLVMVLVLADQAASAGEHALVLVAAAVLFGSLASVPSIGELTSPWQHAEIQLVILTAPWAVAVLGTVIDTTDGDTVLGWLAMAVAAATAMAAAALESRIRDAHVVSLLVGASVALSIGLALLLSTTVTFVALAVQGAGLVVLDRSLGGSVRVQLNAAIVAIVAAAATAVEIVEAWTDDASVGDDLAHAVVIIAVGAAGWATRQQPVRQLTQLAVLAMSLAWLGSVLVHLPQGQAAVSVSWAIVGTGVLVAGAVRKVPELGAAGLGVLALTVAKLLTVDLREVDTLWRAALFLVVGLGLMRLGFLLPRLTGQEEPGPPREPAGRA